MSVPNSGFAVFSASMVGGSGIANGGGVAEFDACVMGIIDGLGVVKLEGVADRMSKVTKGGFVVNSCKACITGGVEATKVAYTGDEAEFGVDGSSGSSNGAQV